MVAGDKLSGDVHQLQTQVSPAYVIGESMRMAIIGKNVIARMMVVMGRTCCKYPNQQYLLAPFYHY